MHLGTFVILQRTQNIQICVHTYVGVVIDGSFAYAQIFIYIKYLNIILYTRFWFQTFSQKEVLLFLSF